MKLFSQQLALRRAFRAAAVIFVAAYLGHYFSFSEEFWVTTAAMMVLQTATGLTARQGVQRFLIITLSVLFSSCFIFYVRDKQVVDVVAALLMAIVCYFSLIHVSRMQVAIPLMIGIVVLVALVIPYPAAYLFHARTFDVMMGGMIGLIGGIILPVSADAEFRKKVIPLLNVCFNYLSININYLFDHALEDKVIAQKNQLEKIWESFPDWVYEAGFTAVLQQGHRHFLVRIEQIRQVLYALNFLVNQPYDRELLKPLRKPMQLYVKRIEGLFHALTTVLSLEALTEGVEDVSDSFYQLEKAFKETIPVSLEALEINPEYVYLANLIDELKELGKMLIILAKALR